MSSQPRKGLGYINSGWELILLILLSPTRSYALDMECHCYNGFDPIVTAFHREHHLPEISSYSIMARE